MKIKTRIFFGDDDYLDTTASFDEFCRGVAGKNGGRDQTYLVRDQFGREYLIPWSAVQLVKNLNNRYDKLLEHCYENSEVGIAAGFVNKLPYFWNFPKTDSGNEVWAWIEEHQCYFPKDFQPIYIKIANILMKEWDVDDVQGKNEELQKNAGFYVGFDWDNDTDLTDLYKYLRSKMPMIERERHEKEDKHD
ncbi:hypothetical protein [Lactobacillus delbrueckii]|uniref:hypothetical protein n=1 Tax=Lactobacillus delbrueckii TaxID=1584 RepID=UPI0017816A13|nr:hypothetical protein [Lactobacillus delbrueckii]MBD5834735.1 hypothetical protein [Lactobacillus delbrueckii]